MKLPTKGSLMCLQIHINGHVVKYNKIFYANRKIILNVGRSHFPIREIFTVSPCVKQIDSNY